MHLLRKVRKIDFLFFHGSVVKVCEMQDRICFISQINHMIDILLIDVFWSSLVFICRDVYDQ